LQNPNKIIEKARNRPLLSTLSIVTLVIVLIAGYTAVYMFQMDPETKEAGSMWPEEISEPNHLVSNSDLIVLGSVEEIEKAEWDTSDGQQPKFQPYASIHHYVHLNVTEELAGEYEDLPVRVSGGTVDNTTMIAEGSPEFSENEEVLVTLTEEDDYYTVYGGYNGKFEVRDSHLIRDNVSNGNFSKEYIRTLIAEFD